MIYAEMPERLIGADCKSAASKDASGGSNPSLHTMKTIEEIQMFLKTNHYLSGGFLVHEHILKSFKKQLERRFFRVGLALTKNHPKGIPFDILIFFLEAERLKKFLSLGKVIVLIADDHALTNSFMTSQQVKR